MIPAETLLDIFSFVDCESVVALQLTRKSIMRVCSENLGSLPHKAYKIDFDQLRLFVTEIAGGQTTVLQTYVVFSIEDLASALSDTRELIGHLQPTDCSIELEDLPVSFDELFSLMPTLRHVPHVTLYDVHDDLLATMRRFDDLRHFSVYVPYTFDWRLLRLPIFLSLRYLALFAENEKGAPPTDAQIDQRKMEDELALYCSDMTSFGAAGRMAVWVQYWYMSRHFVERIIQVVSKKSTIFTIMFSTDEHPVFRDEEFSVTHLDFTEQHLSLTKRTSTYTSRKHGVRALVEDYSFGNVISLRIAVTNDPHPLSQRDVINTAEGYDIC